MKKTVFAILLWPCLFFPAQTPVKSLQPLRQGAGQQATVVDLNKVIGDESHCLVAPEIQGPRDNQASCYCRDALIDIHYLYQTYIVAGRDANLNGAYFDLGSYAREVCGIAVARQRESRAPASAEGILANDPVRADERDWQWNGPEVIRSYPPDDEIEKIKPNDKGWRMVSYRVRLIYRDMAGKILRTVSFTASEALPPNFKNPSGSPK